MNAVPADRPIELWPDALEQTAATTDHFRTVCVVRETSSTQDVATERDLPAGSLVMAGRQVNGRGRLGHSWADTAMDGVAITCVVAQQSPDRLAMAAAVAAASAARACVSTQAASRIAVKWPNDVMAAWVGGTPRKVGGVLIEIRNGRALIGLGMNVRQTTFAGELADRAASLHMLGSLVDRLHVLQQLILRLDAALSQPSNLLEASYSELDRTAGLRLRFSTPQGLVEGVVIRCDPSRGLLVQTEHGEQFLHAHTTRVQPQTVESRSTMDRP